MECKNIAIKRIIFFGLNLKIVQFVLILFFERLIEMERNHLHPKVGFVRLEQYRTATK